MQHNKTMQAAVPAMGAARGAQSPAEEWAARAAESMKQRAAMVRRWYGARSAVFSRLLGEDITRRAVVRVHMATACLIVGASAAVQHVEVAMVSMACAGWMVYRMNAADGNKSGKEEQA